jgi:hypothetical protein
MSRQLTFFGYVRRSSTPYGDWNSGHLEIERALAPDSPRKAPSLDRTARLTAFLEAETLP